MKIFEEILKKQDEICSFFQEEEMVELRSEVTRLKSDFEQKWSSQIKMVKRFVLEQKKI